MRDPRTPSGQPTRQVGLAGRMLLLATLAGGMTAGGFGVGIAGLMGHTFEGSLLLASLSYYLAGALFGAATGAVAGYFGRDENVESRTALRQLGLGLLFAIPLGVAGFAVAGWIGLAPVAAKAGTTVAIGSSLTGAVIGSTILLLSLECGLACLINAARRARIRLDRKRWTPPADG